MSQEYAGRIYALREIAKLKDQMTFQKVDSAINDIQNFLDGNKDLVMKSIELLRQAKEQLETLNGFLREFK